MYLHPLIKLSGNTFYELLFMDSPGIVVVATNIANVSKLYVGVFFLIGVIYEFFKGNRYSDLVIRTIFASFLFAVFNPFLIKSVETSFIYSEQIFRSSAKDNRLLIGMKQAGALAEREIKKIGNGNKGKITLWQKLSIMAKVIVNDPISIVIWILIYIAFLFLKIVYSIMFYLLYVFLPVQALFFIPAPTSAGLQGAFRTYLTLVTTPLVLTVILILVGGSANFIGTGHTLTENLEGLVQLLVSSILLLMAPFFASTLFGSNGFQSAATRIIGIGSGMLTAASLLSKKKILSFPKTNFRPDSQTHHFNNSNGIERNRKNSTKQFQFAKKNKQHSEFFRNDLNEKIIGNKADLSPQETNPAQQIVKRRLIEKKARNFIRLSRGGNFDPQQFQREEKAKAVQLAQKNPQKNWINRNTYLETINELYDNSPPKNRPLAPLNKKINQFKRIQPRRLDEEGLRKPQRTLWKKRPFGAKPPRTHF